jgi:hypothetical protein
MKILESLKSFRLTRKQEKDAQRRALFDNSVCSSLIDANPHIEYVKCKSYRTFYDSTWEVGFMDKMILTPLSVVRDDLESAKGLLTSLIGVKTIEEVLSLDMKKNIHYD